MLVRVVGREWISGIPGGTKIFRRPHIGFAGPGQPIGGRGAAKREKGEEGTVADAKK